jgi:hypothetical protein
MYLQPVKSDVKINPLSPEESLENQARSLSARINNVKKEAAVTFSLVCLYVLTAVYWIYGPNSWNIRKTDQIVDYELKAVCNTSVWNNTI